MHEDLTDGFSYLSRLVFPPNTTFWREEVVPSVSQSINQATTDAEAPTDMRRRGSFEGPRNGLCNTTVL